MPVDADSGMQRPLGWRNLHRAVRRGRDGPLGRIPRLARAGLKAHGSVPRADNEADISNWRSFETHRPSLGAEAQAELPERLAPQIDEPMLIETQSEWSNSTRSIWIDRFTSPYRGRDEYAFAQRYGKTSTVAQIGGGKSL
jgi:hypothetical protein